jgi:hypothetical protein
LFFFFALVHFFTHVVLSIIYYNLIENKMLDCGGAEQDLAFRHLGSATRRWMETRKDSVATKPMKPWPRGEPVASASTKK